jgi:hypothetical protein
MCARTEQARLTDTTTGKYEIPSGWAGVTVARSGGLTSNAVVCGQCLHRVLALLGLP